MKLESLLTWLGSQKGITLAETRQLKHEKKTVYLYTSQLPFPYAGGHAWAPLTIDDGQTEVEVEEIEALLRHLVQGQLEIPES